MGSERPPATGQAAKLFVVEEEKEGRRPPTPACGERIEVQRCAISVVNSSVTSHNLFGVTVFKFYCLSSFKYIILFFFFFLQRIFGFQLLRRE